jgi:hypothetical protein
MGKFNEIYVLTSGCYSDYQIIGVFSTQEKAQTFIEDYEKIYGKNHDFNGIEIYDLDQVIEKKRKYFVRMDRDGNIKEIYDDDWRVKNYKFGYKIYLTEYSGKYYLAIDNVCRANGMTHAVKITNELRTRLIALNRFVEQEVRRG